MVRTPSHRPGVIRRGASHEPPFETLERGNLAASRDSRPPVMAHRTSASVYDRLTERLNRCSQGAPPSASLFQILKILFSEREAALVSVLPLRPFDAAKAASIWKVSEAEARETLDQL